MPYAKVNEINLYYEIHGEGEPLVLIPGLAADISLFKRVIPVLSKEYKVIALDNRGAGKSDKPDFPYTIDMMASDIAGLLDTLGIDKVHIFGESLGGAIAQAFAFNYPQRLLCLVLACTAVGGSNVIGGEEILDAVSPDVWENLTPEESVRRTISILYTQKYIDENPELIEQLVSELLQNPPDPVGSARQYEVGATFDTYERLPEIKSPTLVLAGEEDKLVNPENSRIIASRIPNSELLIVKEVGHGLTRIKETHEMVLDFLKRHSNK